MAKKAISRLRKAKDIVKVIRAVKSEKTGSYSFREEMVPKENLKDFLKK